MIRTVLVDDEALARDGLRLQLQQYNDVSVVDEATDGPRALEAITSLRPDVVFLDIRIPGFDGLEVLRRASSTHLPVVVFVTAFDSYAVRAFDARALDYLLKPIQSQRFHDAMVRVRQTLTRVDDERAFRQQLLQLIASREGPPAGTQPIYYKRFTVRHAKRFVVIDAADVDWFQGASNYVELHVRGREYLLRVSLNELEHKLDPRRFARIHRSTIVNLERISFIQSTLRGDYTVVLTDGSTLRLSRLFRDRVMLSKSSQ